MAFALTLVALVVILALAWRFLGSYMVAVFEGHVTFLSRVEKVIYKLLGVDPTVEQSWQRYAGALIIFSAVELAVSYALMRLQGILPFNPQHLSTVNPALAWNTAVSFVTNTNWQAYSGESTMSYFSQMGVLTVQQFVSAAVGLAVAIALVRGFARRKVPTIGNFWIDITRGTLYVLIPIAFVCGIIFVAQGAVQTLAGPVNVHNALTGFDQTIARGPVGFMESIKQLGTNGGGFFNANGADPYENPTPVTNLLSIVLLLCIPVALTYVFGKMVGNVREGLALLAVMVVLFSSCLAVTSISETHVTPAIAQAHPTTSASGNMEGKEIRFGISNSALYDTASTQTSTGSVDGANDSYTALGGLGLLAGMMLGEVSPGGVGSGLYTILLFALVAVFLGGLMVGRTPEYLGKKIGAKEVKLAAIGILVMPITVLVLTAIAVSTPAGKAGPLNLGPHGFSEVLYAFTSMANNNGSAFAGLNASTPFYEITGSIAMLLGRFAIIIPALALAGVLAAKQSVPSGDGTFRTDGPMFAALLIGVIVIVGGLNFFPALSLGPIVEQVLGGRLF